MSDRIPGTSYWSPIWYRGYRIFVGPYPEWGAAYEFVSDNYDGAPDAFDNRAGYELSIELCRAQIDEIEDDRP